MKTQINYAAEKEILLRNKRSVVLLIATRTGIKLNDSWVEFNSWMKSKSVLKKELHKYSFDELDQLINQFRGLERNFNKSALKTGNKAWYKKNNIPKPSNN